MRALVRPEAMDRDVELKEMVGDVSNEHMIRPASKGAVAWGGAVAVGALLVTVNVTS